MDVCLHDDVLEHVFLHCSLESIGRACQVSRRWRDLGLRCRRWEQIYRAAVDVRECSAESVHLGHMSRHRCHIGGRSGRADRTPLTPSEVALFGRCGILGHYDPDTLVDRDLSYISDYRLELANHLYDVARRGNKWTTSMSVDLLDSELELYHLEHHIRELRAKRELVKALKQKFSTVVLSRLVSPR